MDYTLDGVMKALRSGRHKEVAHLVERLRTKSPEAAVIALENDYYLGMAERVREDGCRLLQSSSLPIGLGAQCATVLGHQLFDDCDLEGSRIQHQRALDLAQRA